MRGGEGVSVCCECVWGGVCVVKWRANLPARVVSDGCTVCERETHLCFSLPLQLERVGIQHQAGSDSYLTGAAFFKMKQVRVYSL